MLSKFVFSGVVSALVLGQAAAATHVNKTDYDDYLVRDDPAGTYSFAAGNNWNLGQPPESGKTYLVQAESGYRILRSMTSAKFVGDSLTLDNGGIKFSHGNPVTVENLIVYDGQLNIASSGSAVIVAGQTSIQDGGHLHFVGAYRRLLECRAQIQGSASTQIVIDESEDNGSSSATTLPYWCVRLSGDNSDFVGSFVIKTLSYGGAYPTALLAESPHALGTGCKMTFASRAALFGNDVSLADGREIEVGASFVLGATGAKGLAFEDVALKGTGSSVLYVTNFSSSAATTLAKVNLSGVSSIQAQTAGLRFLPGYSNAAVDIVSSKDVGIVFDGSDRYPRLGPLSLGNGAVLRITFDGILPDESYKYPIFSSPSLGSEVQVANVALAGDWPLAELVIEDGVLYVVRTISESTVRLKGWATGNVGGELWTEASSGSAAWDDGAPPSGTKNYVVPYCQSLRSRTTTAFPGLTLSILYGASVTFNSSTTVKDLRAYPGGLLLPRGTSASYTFSGQITLPTVEIGRSFAIATEGGTAKLTLAASLLGVGTVEFRGIDGNDIVSTWDFNEHFNDTAKGVGVFTLTGDNSAFKGGMGVRNQGGAVILTGANAMPGNPDRLNSEGLRVYGGCKLVAKNNYSVGANRGLSIGYLPSTDAGGTIEVENGRLLTIDSPLSGNGHLVKAGAGELELAGPGVIERTLKVQAGTLSVSAAVGASALDLAAGSVVLKPNGVLVLSAETPFAGALPIALTVPELTAPETQHLWKTLFRLTGTVEQVRSIVERDVSLVGVSPGMLRMKYEVVDGDVIVSAKVRKGLALIFK